MLSYPWWTGATGPAGAISVRPAATPPTGLAPPETAAILPLRLAAYNVRHNFEVGQLVMWKDGLKNRVRPDYGQPAIVVEVLEAPVVHPTAESLTSDLQDKLDIVLGVMTEDNLFAFFHFDRARFEPYKGL